jgi:ATP-binding cassette, subfamily A (ABC1), member 3
MYPMSRLVKSVVEEKESRMREVMKVMGLHNSVHQLSWLLTGLSVFMWIAVTTAWVANTSFLPNSDFSLLLIYFVLFCLSLISLSFMLSTFFSNSKLAAIVAPVALFCLLLPRFVFFSTNSNEQFEPKVYASLLSPVAFAFGADFIAEAESGGAGVQYSNMDDGEFSFRVVLQMMFVDSILYLVIGWYLDLVMPQEFGTPMSPVNAGAFVVACVLPVRIVLLIKRLG